VVSGATLKSRKNQQTPSLSLRSRPSAATSIQVQFHDLSMGVILWNFTSYTR